MHWYREGNRQRSRILYVFRTPGGVRVGRDPFEPEILRRIETEYPDIDFDWQVVRENQQVVDSTAEPRRPRKRRRGEDEGEAAPLPQATAAERPEAPRREPAPPAPPRPSIPSALEGATPDEQIAFLGRWYPAVRELIPQRTPDPARQEALLALCERLNPAMWTDADQIAAGLQQAGEALERLGKVFTKRRRRARRPRKPEAEPSTPEA
jgi:hypothetical protein